MGNVPQSWLSVVTAMPVRQSSPRVWQSWER